MDQQSWDKGIALLLANLPQRDSSQGVQALRGETYRAHLAHLTAEAWEFTVDACIREEEWFPAIATLLRHASGYQPPAPMEPRRTDEEKDRDREVAKRGMAMIEAEMKRRGIWGEPAKEMP